MANEIIKDEMVNENVEVVETETVETETVNETVNDEVETQYITLDEFVENVKVKDYVSVKDKRDIINLVLENCIYDDNGIYYVDFLTKHIATDYVLLDFYTDYKGTEPYDYLKEIGVFEYIEEKVDVYGDDFSNLYNIITEELTQRVNTLNSVGSVVTRKINEFVSKIPDISEVSNLLGDIPNLLKNIDPNIINIFAKELGNGTIGHQVIDKNKKRYTAEDVAKMKEILKGNKAINTDNK